ATAYTLATNQNIDTLTDGACVSFRLHATNGVNPALAVDGTAAKPLTIAPGTPPDAGMLLAGTIHTVTRNDADDEWRLHGIFVPGGIAKTGDLKHKVLNVTDPGWVLGAGGTIGNPSSNATTRAHADTQDLYVGWHKATASQNTLYPIQDSAGSAS